MPLARHGASGDHRKASAITHSHPDCRSSHPDCRAIYGLLTDARGCPVAVSVFEGNAADPKTLLPQVETVRDRFGIASMVMVGDRGMISNVQIEAMRTMEGVDWITALKSGAIARLADRGQLQPDLFDERNLISFTSEDYPGERLVACRNPELAKLRAAKRQDLIAATERELQKVADMAASGKLLGRDKIGVRIGKVIGKYKVGKHFELDIQEAALSFSVNEKRVAAEAALDGLYVIRTSAAEAEMSAQGHAFEARRGEIEEHEAAFLEMAPGEALFDLVLAFDQPVHRGVKLVFMRVRNGKILRQRCVGPGMGHGELAGFRRDDAARDHRHDEIALARSLAIDQFVEAKPPHGDAHGLDMPVRQREDAVEAAVHGRKLSALESQPDRLSLLKRQGRQVGDGALFDALAIPDAFAQQDGGLGASIGHKVNVHAARYS